MSVHDALPVVSAVVVAVDVGKNMVALSVSDLERHRLFGPVDFAMTRPGLSLTLARVREVLAPTGVVKVGIEAAGHYHRPLLAPGAWPVGWEVLELNPAQVDEQRRVAGRRWVKTDAIDLEAITELVLAGRGVPVTAREQVIGELAAWSTHRTRRVATRTATKNQLLGQLDRSFPGLTLALPDVLGTKVGRLVCYRRISRRRGKKKPIVGSAAPSWSSSGTLADPDVPFNDLGSDHFTRHVNTETKKRNHIRQLEALGYRASPRPAG